MIRSVKILAILLLVSGCGSSYSSPTTPSGGTNPPTTSADVTIDIRSNSGSQSYSPNPATMRVGQTVAWRNTDTLAHTATQDGGAGFDSATLSAGASSTPRTMSTAGTFTYHCTIHPGMVGTLTVQQ